MTKKKAAAIMLSVIMAVTAASAVFGYTTYKAQSRENSEMTLKVISSGVYNTVEGELSKPISIALTMANDTFLKNELKNESGSSEAEMTDSMSEYLTQIKEKLGADTSFVVSHNSGKYYTYEGLNKIIDIDNDPHDIWYSAFADGHKAYDLDVDVDEVNSGRWTVFINARIEDENGKLLGVCGVGVTMDQMQSSLKQYEDSFGIKIDLVDSSGLVQVDTDSINIENAYLYDVQYGQEHDGYTYAADDGSMVMMRYIEDLNWYLVLRDTPDNMNNKIITIIIHSVLVFTVLSAAYLILKKNEKE